jgi:hypothetical protein
VDGYPPAPNSASCGPLLPVYSISGADGFRRFPVQRQTAGEKTANRSQIYQIS